MALFKNVDTFVGGVLDGGVKLINDATKKIKPIQTEVKVDYSVYGWLIGILVLAAFLFTGKRKPKLF